MKLKLIAALILPLLLFQAACAKREPVSPVSRTGTVGIQPPEEPLMSLAWKAATQIQLGLQPGEPLQLRMLPLDNSAGIPAGAADYFQAVLETRLQVFGIQMPGDAPFQLQGSIYWLRNSLVYGFKLRKQEQVLAADSVSIPRDEHLENTIAQFAPPGERHEHVHAEAAIPTPVAQLKEAPLDVGQLCPTTGDPCDIVLLYADRVEILNWKTLALRVLRIPSGSLSASRSRAPSGKIVHVEDGYILLSNDFSKPVTCDPELQDPASTVAIPKLPAAIPGLNSYALGDGRFSDFDLLPEGGLVVVETNHHLGVARAGSLTTAANPAGGAVAVHWPQIYTSAPVLPGETDSVQKYTYLDGSLTLNSSRPAVGTILDLSVTDLNRDGTAELLVTVQRPEGVFIEVWEVF